MTSELPHGWTRTILGDLCSVEYGKGLAKKNRDDTGSVGVYGSAGEVGRHSSPLVEEPVIIVGRKGNAGSVWLTDGPSWPIDTTYFLRPPKELSADFLALQLGSCDLVQKDSSTTIPSLRRPDLEATPIRVAPVLEQKRIVAAVEEHFSRLDAVEAVLAAEAGKLDRLRRRVLAEAFSGRLIPQDLDDEPASTLLQRIVRPAQGDCYISGEIPDGWEWASLGAIAETQLGKMLSKESRQGLQPYPYLRNRNVQWHRFDLSDIALMDFTDSELRKYELCQGDLLVCEGGEVGRCAVWNGPSGEMFFQKALHRVRPLKGIEVKWIEYFLRWSADTGRFKASTSGSTIDHLPQRDLRMLPVPVPPTEEQGRLVPIVEEHFSRLDAVGGVLADAACKLEALRRSILTDAFSGRLVPQDPNDEPASALLVRIAASRHPGQ